MELRFVVLDPVEGPDFFPRAEEAKLNCEERLEAYREQSGDSGWEDGVRELEWGEFFPMGKVVQTKCEPAPPGSEFQEMWDFELRDVGPHVDKWLVAICREGALEATAFDQRELAVAFYADTSQQWSEAWLCRIESGPGSPLPDANKVLERLHASWYEAGKAEGAKPQESKIQLFMDRHEAAIDLFCQVHAELSCLECLPRSQATSKRWGELRAKIGHFLRSDARYLRLVAEKTPK